MSCDGTWLTIDEIGPGYALLRCNLLVGVDPPNGGIGLIGVFPTNGSEYSTAEPWYMVTLHSPLGGTYDHITISFGQGMCARIEGPIVIPAGADRDLPCNE